MAFIAAAAIGGGAALLGGYLSSNAAKDAAQMQADAARDAMGIQKQMFDQQRSDNAQFRNAGYNALSQMQDGEFQKDFTNADFVKDPGYDFRMQEGQKALERSAAARGGLMGGGFGRALSRYGQDYASNEYGNAYNRFNNDKNLRFNRLSAIANMGQNSVNMVGNAGQNFANQTGNIMASNANAQGAAGIAQANAWGGALSGIGNSAAMYAGYKQNQDFVDALKEKNRLSALGGKP